MDEGRNARYGNGMNEVYVPPGDTKDGNNTSPPAANIIFVHGLCGHPWRTWAYEATKERKKPFWPKDLLPKELENVRVFSFGYDADIEKFMSSTGKNSVQDHGANLLHDLSFQLESQKENYVPFIFVVHSLGGLVLKEALNQSHTASDHRKRVVESTHGIIFLGTPHRGSSAASYGKIAVTLTKIFAAQSANTKILRTLEVGSEVLERITRSFYETWHQHGTIQAYSFHEEKDMRLGIFRMRIVPPESARIGHVHEFLGSIPEDHRYIAKYRDSRDTGFVKIRQVLTKWVDEIGDSMRKISTADYQDCLESLNEPDARARIRQVSPNHKDSFEWLFTDKVAFREWLADDKDEFSPIFWITGKPGSGKSTIMRFAMQDPRLLSLVPDGEGKPLGYFFHLRGKNTVQKSLHGMLRELVYQLLLQFPNYFNCIKARYQSLVLESRSKRPEWDVENLKQCLLSLAELPVQSQVRSRFILFIDALDENESAEENKEVVGIMKQLAESFALWKGNTSGNILKICLASRPWPLFQKELGNDPRINKFAIHEFTKTDIENYTRQNLTWAMSEVNKSLESSLEHLIKMIVGKAHGVFIWVRIVVQQLCETIIDGGSSVDLEDYITTLPDELDELYRYTMARIKPSYGLESLVSFRIMLCSKTQLTLKGLYDAVTVCIRGFSPESDLTPFQRLAWLKSRTGGLIEIVEPTSYTNNPFVQLVHQTAHEFVRSGLMGLNRTAFLPFWWDLDGNYFISTAILKSSALKKEFSSTNGNIDRFEYLRALDAALDLDKGPYFEDSSDSQGPLHIAIQKHLASTAPLAPDGLPRAPMLQHMMLWPAQRLSPSQQSLNVRFKQGYPDNLSQIFRYIEDGSDGTTLFAQYCQLIAEDLYDQLFWLPITPDVTIQIPDLLCIAALGPRVRRSRRTDRPRMVRRILEHFGSNPDRLLFEDLIPNLWSRHWEAILGKYDARAHASIGTTLLNTLMLIDEHPLVDEDTRLQIAEVLLSKGAPLEAIHVTDNEGKINRMSMLQFALRFKSKEWYKLLLRYTAQSAGMGSAASMAMLPFPALEPGGVTLMREKLYHDLDTEANRSSYPGWVLGSLVWSSVGFPELYRAIGQERHEWSERSDYSLLARHRLGWKRPLK
ncbi:hypothetical protein F5X96DRAFT_488961 [Biscogniauxia mediterranea]|nr:hypothetical protein F5X96DRAFT_488961 [Biscogniauxia mediterranea]